ncbi:MAG TPA: ATP-binding protein [Candidatus Omnitrophota bacterium]|nr:ATP-binding protein [Candidatus Omnitrophota bacterium]HQQ06162.1 ATP-binding protein [Candidatus Omnitrophota bacterium]
MTENNPSLTRAKLILNLVISIRQIAIYPANHPTVVNSIRAVLDFLNALFAESPVVAVSVSPDNNIVVNNEAMTDKSVGDLQGFVPIFNKLGIEGLMFTPDIKASEVAEFIKIAALDAAQIKQNPDLNALFASRGITHIQAKQFSYIKVEKGMEDAVVGGPGGAGAGGTAAVKDEQKAKLKDYFSHKITDQAEISGIEAGIFQAVGSELKEKGKVGAASKNLLKKFITHAGPEADAAGRLRAALVDLGCPAGDVDTLLARITDEIAKGPAVRQRGGSDGDTAKLAEENRALKEQLAALESTVAEISEKFAYAEKQNKRISDEKQRIDNIVHNMAEGMVVVDAEGKIVLVNQTAESLLGITRNDVGKYLKDVVTDEHLLTVTRKVSAGPEDVVEKDIELVSGNESTKRVLRTSSAVVEDPNGNTVGMVTTLNDITRQKEVEKLKAGFVASVSHELRTPLVAIEKSISMIMDQSAGNVSDTQKQFLTIADRNLKRLSILINDLLDLSKLEARKMQIKRELVGIDKVIEEAIAGLDTWARTKSVVIEKDIAAGLPLISIDQNRILQVLINLIGNAIKYTPAQGRITVSCGQPDADGMISVRVADTGPGIPPEDIGKIFEKFYQTRERPSSDIAGTGIGLTIVKELVELHGGKVWAESEHGHGAAFIFTLPLVAPVTEGEQGG